MGRNWNNNSTNVRISTEAESRPSLLWSLLADWTVGEITPSFTETEQSALEYELFHRETREGALPSVSRA